VAPREVLLLLALVQPIEVAIVAVLLRQILPVSTIFVTVPGMVIFAILIVVAFFLVISVVSSRCDRSDQGGAQCERA